MSNKRLVTERDLRMPEFRDADPTEFEFREDGAIVRKDRWERGMRDVANLFVDAHDSWEIRDIVWTVKALVEDLRAVQEAAADAIWDEMMTGALYAA